MKKAIFLICLVLLTMSAGCTPREAPAEPEAKQAVDNGADAFLRGENPEFMERFAEK